ncbi:MAG: tRNA (guanosine(37)-N1)-methyltransferase TrmD [Patescibacteria group bacterium]
MNFHIITIFPESFDSYLKESIIGRAIENKLIAVEFYNPRDFLPKTDNNYKPVDDKPYGGGPGMILKLEPIIKTVEAIKKKILPKSKNLVNIKNKKIKVIIFSPSGKKFDTTYAKKISQKYSDIILISGRYEGIDARVKKIIKSFPEFGISGALSWDVDEISIGDYVLTGGELPAMVLIDCISRQIPNVLGKYDSLEENRISSSEVYTRPEIFKYNGKNYKVPKVLLSGNHKKIEEWKLKSKSPQSVLK